MSLRPFLLVTGIIFGAIAVMHLWRILSGWPVVVAGNAVPMWASWIGLIVLGLLAVQAFRHANRSR